MFEGSEASKSLLGDFSDHNESDDEGGDHKIRKYVFHVVLLVTTQNCNLKFTVGSRSQHPRNYPASSKRCILVIHCVACYFMNRTQL